MAGNNSECQKCGNCCRYTMVRLRDEDVTQPSLKYYRVRGMKHVVLKTGSGEQLVMLIIPMPCPHLTKENTCDCYANRPEICRKYDGTKDPTCNCKRKGGAVEA